MAKVSYQPLGPLLSGDGSRAFLGLQITEGAPVRPVVLVWVPEEVAKDPQLSATIERETKRAGALTHPNVLKVHGLVTLDEGLARVVEFADGEPLRKILDAAKKLPPRLAALVAADAAMGVHYAHVAGHEDGTPFLHGDLRPETLIVSFSGVCKVAGYGALGVAPREPGGRRLPGRRSHCAPEQIVGGREALNRQTDVYLLGLVLYECLTGQIPFKDDPHFDDAVVNRSFPPLLPEDVPPPLIRVVEQAIAKRAYDRFPTARAFRDAIERAVGVLPAHEELAIFLRRFFPDDSPARTARGREIESGIAELSRREAESASSEPPSQAEPLGTAPATRRRSTRFQASLLVVLTLALLGFWYVSQRNESAPGLASSAEKTAKSERKEAVAEVRRPAETSDERPTGRESDESSEMKDPGPAAEHKQSAVAEAAPIGRGIATEASATVQPAVATAPAGGGDVARAALTVPAQGGTASLELTVEPPVEVTIDGHPAGRSPISIAITPGKHTVQFSDPSRGINVSRSVRVLANGKTTQRLVIGKGTVEVSAPNGAVIYIDGKPVGTAPLGEIPVFEGKHRILATLGTAKWQQGFTVGANERMSFKIEAIEQ